MLLMSFSTVFLFILSLGTTSQVKADSTANISKTQPLTQKLSGWIKSPTGKTKRVYFDFGFHCLFKQN